MHQQAAAVFDTCWTASRPSRRRRAKRRDDKSRPAWPMLIMRTPKGWTGPKFVDGKPVEGTWRAHQVPLAGDASKSPSTCAMLEEWMRSYKPEELFDEKGHFRATWRRLRPRDGCAWA
jgi:xylulose-5-phosphate/fructose-6-phosphate phosphoketolase